MSFLKRVFKPSHAIFHMSISIILYGRTSILFHTTTADFLLSIPIFSFFLKVIFISFFDLSLYRIFDKFSQSTADVCYNTGKEKGGQADEF